MLLPDGGEGRRGRREGSGHWKRENSGLAQGRNCLPLSQTLKHYLVPVLWPEGHLRLDPAIVDGPKRVLLRYAADDCAIRDECLLPGKLRNIDSLRYRSYRVERRFLANSEAPATRVTRRSDARHSAAKVARVQFTTTEMNDDSP